MPLPPTYKVRAWTQTQAFWPISQSSMTLSRSWVGSGDAEVWELGPEVLISSEPSPLSLTIPSWTLESEPILSLGSIDRAAWWARALEQPQDVGLSS